MALRGVRVLELAGLAPAPFCGMVLSDFGAEVIRIDRAGPGSPFTGPLMSRGKRSIAVNLKNPEGVNVVKTMAKDADVLIEPFRKGVMEKLGIGPDTLLKSNPRLIYARMTGFGQSGPLADRAGHDINYLAISGVLSKLGRKGEKPLPPINLLADFAGGGLMCALGIAMALHERTMSGQGQVIDANMVEGAAYVGSFLWATRHLPMWGPERGTGWLDSGAPWYDTYETSDGLHMSVGAIEPQFYAHLLSGLDLSPEDYPQFEDWPAMKDKFTAVFKSRTQADWSAVFESRDACVMPVVPMDTAHAHPHNAARGAFREGGGSPNPAPGLSRTPARPGGPEGGAGAGQHTREVLRECGYSDSELDVLEQSGAVEQAADKAKL